MFRSILLLALVALSCVVLADATSPPPAAAAAAAPAVAPPTAPAPAAQPTYVPGNKVVATWPAPVPVSAANPCHKACTDKATACVATPAAQTDATSCQKANFACVSACKRTNGPSSAYRRGQKGQQKDANGRHHAKNGKFQKETAKNSKGRLFDRRSGQLKAGPGSPKKAGPGSPKKAPGAATDAKKAPTPAKAGAGKKAGAAAPKAAGAAPSTPTKGSPAKRTNGPSSAYRRGQKGQAKTAGGRHQAKNGKFQREFARNAKGQWFDRRTGKILPCKSTDAKTGVCLDKKYPGQPANAPAAPAAGAPAAAAPAAAAPAPTA